MTNDDLQKVGWDPILEANTKLYDMLINITSGDALQKIETTKGDAGS